MKPAPAVLLLVACGGYIPRAPDSSAERETATDAALTAWEARFGAVPRCWESRGELGWASADSPAFDALCRRDDIHACTVLIQNGPAAIVMRAVPREQSAIDRSRAHELVHWLLACSGRVPNGDPEHADGEVWPRQVEDTLAGLEALR